MKNNIDISIITLTKSNNYKLISTLESIYKQKHSSKVELIIVDGSSQKNEKKIEIIIKNYSRENDGNKIIVKYLNSRNRKIFGIYECMNLGKKVSKGKYIIFLNAGDYFFNNDSLEVLTNASKKTKKNFSIIFGQAQIITNHKISWFFPGKRVSNIKNWLKFFEPNHQSMLISRALAKNYDFYLDYNLIADGYWKRKIIEQADEILFINKGICKFKLDGISSTKPSRKLLSEILINKKISIMRKIIFILKYIFPEKLFYFYYLLQKYKALFFEIIF